MTDEEYDTLVAQNCICGSGDTIIAADHALPCEFAEIGVIVMVEL